MDIIEDFIINSNGAKTKEELFKLYQKSLASFGFDKVVYSLINDHPSINRKKEHSIEGNYPKDWMDYYMKNNYFEIDPTARYVFTTSEAQTWEHIVKKCKISRKQRTIMEEAKDANLMEGIIVPLHGTRHEIAGVGMASSIGSIKPDKNTLSMIRAISQQFHMAYSDFFRSERKVELVYLTPREKDILSWAANGKSNSAIGSILSVSENTIKFHFKNIMKKLNACNKQTAIITAITRGLISPYTIYPVEG